MPVLPLVGSTMTRVLVDLPALLAGLDHRDADAVLHAGERIEELALGQHGRLVLGDSRLIRTSGVPPIAAVAAQNPLRGLDLSPDLDVAAARLWGGATANFMLGGHRLDAESRTLKT